MIHFLCTRKISRNSFLPQDIRISQKFCAITFVIFMHMQLCICCWGQNIFHNISNNLSDNLMCIAYLVVLKCVLNQLAINLENGTNHLLILFIRLAFIKIFWISLMAESNTNQLHFIATNSYIFHTFLFLDLKLNKWRENLCLKIV